MVANSSLREARSTFADTTVLITGASSGIGLAIAEEFAHNGARVLVHGRDESRTRSVADQLGNAKAILADLSDPDAVLQIEGQLSGENVDVLVNNAAFEIHGSISSVSAETLSRIFQVNFMSAVLLASVLLPQLAVTGLGAVVNVGSIHETVPVRGNMPYAAAKAALAMFAKTASLEWADLGVRVNTVSPGAIRTDMNREVIASLGEHNFEAWIPSGRIGTAMDVASAVLFLASERASYINGATIVVDGSYSNNLLRY